MMFRINGTSVSYFLQPPARNPIFWNTAAFSNITPVQLYSWIYIVETNGLNIHGENERKVVIDPIAILAIGEVQDPYPSKMYIIFHDYR
jgi:hypothetical protein